ncbi:putative PIN and TRAM-domain containing protein YacL [Candidatus Entotheonellaceae bacterium PAL068K]
MGLYIIRIIMLLVLAWVGAFISMTQGEAFPGAIGAGIGLVVGGAVWGLERYLRTIPLQSYLYGTGGLLGGLLMGALGSFLMAKLPLQHAVAPQMLSLLLYVICAYCGLMLGLWKGPEVVWRDDGRGWTSTNRTLVIKILDTSVIIDGRIADICEADFLEGPLLVPQFVLKELQQIAGSSDTLKRNRGRRGLDILQRMQAHVDIDIRIVDNDFPNIREVDAKLVALGRALKGKLLTNDYNLNKVAELQGVPVLNVNQLANVVKPVVLPGEIMHVYVMKEGKEYGQGVAYLDDGTMVVIDNARKYLGKSIDVAVTSILQTTAGRMIFTRLKDEFDRETAVESR